MSADILEWQILLSLFSSTGKQHRSTKSANANILCGFVSYSSIASVLLWGEVGGHYCYLFVMLHQLIGLNIVQYWTYLSPLLLESQYKTPLVFYLFTAMNRHNACLKTVMPFKLSLIIQFFLLTQLPDFCLTTFMYLAFKGISSSIILLFPSG